MQVATNNNNIFLNNNYNHNNGGDNRTAAVYMSAEIFIEQMRQKVMYADQYLTMRGYKVQQLHGQRISINCTISQADAERARNARNNEIFIGKLPRDLFEDELLPALESIGSVYKIRYMMDFSNSNRGFCFVQYTTMEEAIMACRMLNNLRLRSDKDPIGVKLSFDNKTLFFGNLPPDCTESRLVQALEKYQVEGIVGAQMADSYSSDKSPYHYRGRRGRYQMFNNMAPMPPVVSRYCHVHFESHEAATKARRLLLPGVVKLFNRRLTCDWGKPDRPPKEVTDLLDELRNRTFSASI